MPSRRTRKIQWGLETTAGTAVAADTIYRGQGLLEDTREIVEAPEDVGYISGVDRVYTQSLGATLSMDAVPATYEFLPVVLSCGINQDTSGTADGVGSDYIYSHAGATTTAPTLATLTLEAGDAQRVDEMEYSFVESFTLEGQAGQPLNLSANWIGRQATDAEFTGALSLADVHEIMFSQGKLYIDTAGGTIGTTQVSGTLLGMSLNVTTGATAQFGANGQLYFEKQAMGEPDMTLELTYEHNSSAEAEITAWRNKTARQMRLIWEGDAFETAGTTYSNYTFIMDFAGKYLDVSTLEDQDGNDTVRCTFKPRYNVTADLFAEFVVVNEEASW